MKNYSIKVDEIKNWINTVDDHFTIWPVAVEPPIKGHSVVWVFHCEEEERAMIFADLENFQWDRRGGLVTEALQRARNLNPNTIQEAMNVFGRPLISSTAELA